MWYKVRHDMMSACRTWRHAEAPISIEYPDFSKNSKRQSIRKLCLLKSFNGYTVQEKTGIAKWHENVAPPTAIYKFINCARA